MPWSNQGGDQPPKPEPKSEPKSDGTNPSSDGKRNPWGSGNAWGRARQWRRSIRRRLSGRRPFRRRSQADLAPISKRGSARRRKSCRTSRAGISRRAACCCSSALSALLWLATGFYTVEPNQVGLNLVFGRYVGKTGPGLNYNWPEPLGSTLKLDVTDRNSIDIGTIGRADSAGARRSAGRKPDADRR